MDLDIESNGGSERSEDKIPSKKQPEEGQFEGWRLTERQRRFIESLREHPIKFRNNHIDINMLPILFNREFPQTILSGVKWVWT